ncbi:DUF2637 domain-containing protein [Actinoplanes sp. TFC3]|uniref:DUF2637 domain-containing protein n=1 Tax=Actinoplanes sp. TFC3 TaxID=1710355 RepID=UPI000835136F|nr:DUF2637 domain-containing protein [Actinoplanes sp. TFC3]
MKLRQPRSVSDHTVADESVKTSNLTEQFATEYAKSAVPNMLKAIEAIKRYNRFALLGALATSYLHQAHYLWQQGADYFAYIVPLIFDANMVSMLIVVRTAGIAKDAKRGALIVFAGTALLSATVNFLAPGSLGLRVVFALVVVLVIGVELVAGRIRPDFAAIEQQAAELLAAANTITSTPATGIDPVTTTPTAPVEPNPPAAVLNPPDTASEPPTPVPAHLLTTARFSTVQHEQTTGRPITVDELATRMSVTPAVATQLLNAIHPSPARINGHTPALTGGAR